MSARLVVAPRRDRRGAVDPRWQDVVRAVPGIAVIGADGERLVVTADAPGAAEDLRRALGDDFHVEAVVPRSPAG